MRNTIEVRDLHKRYGSSVAVDGLSFTVQPGLVTGFVGPNGAGKSTTMRVILGLDAAQEGTALVDGRPYRELRTPLRTVGTLLDASAVHPGRRACHHLLWLAHSNGLPPGRIDEVLDLVGLSAVGRRRAGGFSLGMKQRLGIAAALLGDPPILLFDEPVNGLDPEGVHWIRGFLRACAAEGRTVLVASHLMSELADTADHLIIVGRGRLLADTSVRDLLDAASDDRVLLRTGDDALAATILAEAGASTDTAEGRLAVTGLPADRIIGLLTARGVAVSEVVAARPSLEQAYLRLTEFATEYRSPAGGSLQ
jgi:ABC-2 type transport system ATP-binding protein